MTKVKKMTKMDWAQVSNWEDALKLGMKSKNDEKALRLIAKAFRVDFQKLKDGLKYL